MYICMHMHGIDLVCKIPQDSVARRTRDGHMVIAQNKVLDYVEVEVAQVLRIYSNTGAQLISQYDFCLLIGISGSIM